jgi:hypothetical protein
MCGGYGFLIWSNQEGISEQVSGKNERMCMELKGNLFTDRKTSHTWKRGQKLRSI